VEVEEEGNVGVEGRR